MTIFVAAARAGRQRPVCSPSPTPATAPAFKRSRRVILSSLRFMPLSFLPKDLFQPCTPPVSLLPPPPVSPFQRPLGFLRGTERAFVQTPLGRGQELRDRPLGGW